MEVQTGFEKDLKDILEKQKAVNTEVFKVVLSDGRKVKVNILVESSGKATSVTSHTANEIKEKLRGSVLKYDDPFEPAVAESEWEAH